MFYVVSISVCHFRNFVLVFGGTGFPFGEQVCNDLFVLDLKQRHWKRCHILDEQPESVYGAVNRFYCLIFCFNFS